MKTVIVLLIALLAPAPYVLASEETPHQGVRKLIKLYQARDFATLIRERYTERHKAEAAGKMHELTDIYARRLAAEETLRRVISRYSECLEVDPVIADNPNPQVTETARVALFHLEAGPLKLYLQKTGKWGFHM